MADEPTRAIDDYCSRTARSRRRTSFKARTRSSPAPFLYDEADGRLPGLLGPPGGASCVDWSEDWHTICEWELPFAKWFIGGQLNVADNCLDRHVEAGRGDKVAFHWEGEPGDTPHDHLRRAARRGAALRQRR